MATSTTGWVYAKTVNEQVNPNLPVRNHWKYLNNAVGKSDKYAVAQYTRRVNKGKVVQNYPYTVTAHDFRLDIPSNAYIREVEIQVRMKSSVNANIEAPRGVMCIYGVGWSKHITTTNSKGTGWYNGLYLINPSRKLSTNFATYSYTISGSNISKAGFKAKDLNASACGIDLVFDDDKIPFPCNVYLQWVRIRVDYDVPSYTLTHDGAVTSESQPRQTVTGVTNTVKFNLEQSTNAYGGNQCLRLDVPFGTKLISATPSKGSFNSSNNNWTVNCDGKTKASLTVRYIDYTVDTQAIKLLPCTINDLLAFCKFWYRSGYGRTDDFGNITTQLITNTPHKRHDCCFAVSSKVISSNDTNISFSLVTDNGFSYENVTAELDTSLSSENVSYTGYSNGSFNFTVPQNKQVDICFRFCLRPLTTGNHTIYAYVDGSNHNVCEFKVADPYIYHFSTKSKVTDTDFYTLLNDEIIGFLNHRIASKLDTGAFVLPCKFKDNDSVMTMSAPQIHMYKWEQIDYIGCVPIEHHHFDPKSTYKDKLLDSHYKNKRYMGKELASDETITLNIRLHPQQVTTVQGLVDMDKPVPINANHRSFEGDSLNHRGWAELYGITSEKTNPHWYKCSIDVKYLTHNLNTRFKIDKGVRTFNYEIPSVLAEVVVSGERLSLDQNTDYFLVDTDGTYTYNEDTVETEEYKDGDGNTVTYTGLEADEPTFASLVDSLEEDGYNVLKPLVTNETIKVLNEYDTPDELKNNFTLDEGQHLTIVTREELKPISHVSMSWISSQLSETKENAISRVTQLIDSSTNQVVFEYEYEDFDFTDTAYNCHVIGRRLVKGDYEVVINDTIQLHPLLVDEDVALSDETEEISHYGSNLHFMLNQNKLTVEDDGFSGKAVKYSDIELEGDTTYYWQTKWVNHNTDGEDSDIDVYIDMEVQDTILASDYSTSIGNMYISPFPVSDKKIVFSRNAEEGIIYYLEDDKQEFSYLIEPYYQYHNGVDLRTSDGISIFNLNYGYKTVYLENGLVSLGINRLNGQMYLRKWDNQIQDYITLFRFQLSNYDDVNINSISDDKIELQASNTLISMYRGHPYVIFKHQLEDIGLTTNFKRVWGQKVGDNSSNYPVYFDLLNSQNMLPECVGGKLDPKCVTLTEDSTTEQSLTNVTLELDLESTIYENVATDLNVTGLSNGDVVHFLVDGDEIGHTTYPTPLEYTFADDDAHEVIAVYVGSATKNHAVSDAVIVHPQVVESTGTGGSSGTGSSSSSPEPTGQYKLEIFSPSTFKYLDDQPIKFRLTRGGEPVSGKSLERVLFTSIWTSDTDANGYANTTNKSKNWTPKSGKYKIGARFYQGGQLIKQVWKDVTLKKANTQWTVTKTTSNNTNYVYGRLQDEWGNNIANQKVTVYINGKKYTNKTSSSGLVRYKVTGRKVNNFKFVFGGNKFYNGKTKNSKVKF